MDYYYLGIVLTQISNLMNLILNFETFWTHLTSFLCTWRFSMYQNSQHTTLKAQDAQTGWVFVEIYYYPKQSKDYIL